MFDNDVRRTMTLVLTISKEEIGLHDFNVENALNKTNALCFVICFEYLRLSIQECYQNEILPEQSVFCTFLF